MLTALYDYVFGKSFSVDQIPQLDGKVAIVTGASAGIGKFSADALAAKGAHVILACRSQPKAEAVLEEIKKANPSAKVEFLPLDLASLASVKTFAELFIAKKLAIDILLNNAGVMAPQQFTLSKDGIELQMASNHLGHFYLTNLLLPIIEETAKKNGSARIVNVSSTGHVAARSLGLDTLNDAPSYNAYVHYGKSKLANILFTRELQKRLDSKGSGNIYVNTLHPGVIATDLTKEAAYAHYFSFLMPYLLITPERGSLTQLFLATSPKVVSLGIKAQYYVPVAQQGTPSVVARDDALAEELWKWSEATIREKGFAL
ncbi:hypothetical protein DFJ73DRAFT_820179 [Zopfochytrium polystomum]|nr:hypothetical protein DFJ73DRAFT_820179 [Zopfochytrium polystomum]